MTLDSSPSADAHAATPGPASGPRNAGRGAGVALMLGGGLSNQAGASVAALAFPVLGPAGVVAVRQWVAAAVLVAVARPRLRRLTAAQWRPVLGLAAVFAAMNLSLYTAIDRIGLGLAVTLEFLGPLAVALAGSRRRADLAAAVAAACAVGVLTRPTPSTDYPGIALALLAAACWAGYILLNRTVGSRVPGLEGSAAAALLSAALYLPVGVGILWHHPPTATALGCALAAGVLCSAVPMLADLLALRRVPAHFFGVFMSVNPVFAALAGLFVLGQRLDLLSWVAVAVIVVANVAALSGAGPAGDGPRPPGGTASARPRRHDWPRRGRVGGERPPVRDDRGTEFAHAPQGPGREP
ncbi:EamA family transporter [Streptomyces sp. NPDC049916]|uniref:EamA family transporter n=1 Tax=Streptomyces sp. NPDC049916 TaxID=3155156 RepID=UPI0034296B5D